MTLAWKIFTPSVSVGRFVCVQSAVSRKCLFHTCWTSPVRFLKKPHLSYGLRRQTTNVVESNVSNGPPRVANAGRTKTRSELRQLILLAAPEKWTLVTAIGFLLISSSVTMAVPFCLGKVVDIIYTVDKEKMKEKLRNLSLVLMGVFLVGGLSNFGRVYLMSAAGHRITQALRNKAYTAILKQETALFDKLSTGELVGRLTGDTQIISTAVTSNVSDGLRSAIMAATGISMMFYVSPQLALVGLSIVPPVAVMAVFYGRHLRSIARDVQSSLGALSSTAEEKISNIRTVKAFAQELNEIKRYDSKLQELLRLCYKETLYRGIFFGITGVSGNAIILAILCYGGAMISDGSITIGNLSAFIMYAAYVGISFNGLSSFYSELNKALGANARLFELISREPAIPVQGGRILNHPLSGEICYKNVSFSYPTRKDSPILKNFDLDIRRCSRTAIVGFSGSGKSTVALLLLRLYDPNAGSILLDGHDLRELDPVWVKSQMGFVSQEPVLFSGTIKENILYGSENVGESDVQRAAERAYVFEFSKRMTDGLDTLVGERGVTLSGGQRQRVAIARALIKKPKILILDEATSALDAASENFVQQALERAAEGRTVLTIAHRLSTIKNADEIVVLDQGRVVETGTYSDLINLENGYFKKLVQHQTFA